MVPEKTGDDGLRVGGKWLCVIGLLSGSATFEGMSKY
jgi:hypothetical protein